MPNACEYLKLDSKEIDERLKNGPEIVSAKFVIPYPPGFPIMVPGQVITHETITFMRKLDVKEIHGYNAALGLELLKPAALAALKGKPRPRATGRRDRDKADHESLLQWLAANPYILLFFGRCSAPWCSARSRSRATAWAWWPPRSSSAPALSAWASTYGVEDELDNFAKSLFYYLFMYGVGLRVGPSFINSLKGDGLKFTFLAVFCSVWACSARCCFAKLWDLPAGAAGGILAGAMTMSAAIGSAEEAVQQGAFKLPPGETPSR